MCCCETYLWCCSQRFCLHNSHRAKRTFLSLPEFMHTLLAIAELLLDTPSVSKSLPEHTSEVAFRTLLERFILPKYEDIYGTSSSEATDAHAVQEHDAKLPELEDEFRQELDALYDRYIELLPGRGALPMDIDLFELFVSDCRLFRFVLPDTVEALFMQHVSANGNLDKRQFHDTCKSLLRENYIISRRKDGEFDPKEYTRPMDDSTFLTPCVRCAGRHKRGVGDLF